MWQCHVHGLAAEPALGLLAEHTSSHLVAAVAVGATWVAGQGFVKPVTLRAGARTVDAMTSPLAGFAPGDTSTPAFRFDGGAGSFLAVGIGSTLLSIVTLGIAAPWAVCMFYRWQTEHTIVNGRRLRFTGSGGRLFGAWIVWWLLIVVTLGIYSLWVWPRMTKWCVEHQGF